MVRYVHIIMSAPWGGGLTFLSLYIVAFIAFYLSCNQNGVLALQMRRERGEYIGVKGVKGLPIGCSEETLCLQTKNATEYDTEVLTPQRYGMV